MRAWESVFKRCYKCDLSNFMFLSSACSAPHRVGEPSHRMELTTLTPTQARELGAEAFAFGFPLLLMTATMRRATAPAPGEGIKPNCFGHLPRFPDPTFRAIVAANADTLYSLAWLDLADQPMLLELPDTGGRSYLMPLMDAWTNVFASLAPHTVGDKGGTFAIVGPGWSGSLPSGLRRIDAPTNNVWAIYHLLAGGPTDLDASRAIQQDLTLTPMGTDGTTDVPPRCTDISALDPLPAAHQQVMDMDAEEFLAELAAQMATNPPAPVDAPLLERLAGIQLRPGERFDWSGLSAVMREGLTAGLGDGKEMVASAATPETENGWEVIHAGAGSYGVDYLRRARTANFALGVNRPEDAIFPLSAVDSAGQRLSGAHRYTLSFESGTLPPVGALWSLAIYDLDQLLVDNPLGRYALGSRDELEVGADGSLEIAIQCDPPNGSSANWLPAPEGDFNLMLHMYSPSQQALDGDWAIPPVQRVD